MRDALPAVLSPVLGSAVTVSSLQALTGGASRSTWAFEVRTDGAARKLILRTGPPDDVHAAMETEALTQRLAAAQGAPVPHVLIADNSTTALGLPFLVCDAIEGETIARKILRALEGDEPARTRLLRQCAHALAAIHRVDPVDVDVHGNDQMSLWRDQLDAMGDTTATFEWALRWLAANRPPSTPPVLVHGDFRMGNLIVRDGALAAVLDWELVHRGEIYEDLAWFCIRAWRFGAPHARAAGGLGSLEDFLSAYEEAGGTTVDRVGMRWWLIRATLSWGIICRYQAERHLSGRSRSVELAAIGRRVCETEWDLLELLEATP
ncbi:MAG: phosphotransferase family protein [Mycobacteriaceae bacterium]|nr:phosphotransferase family protein [Mycobacteriaceae bacterium]